MKSNPGKQPKMKALSSTGKAAQKPTIRLAALSEADRQRVMACRSRQAFNRLAAEFSSREPTAKRQQRQND